MTNTICLNERYSTTRLVTKKKPEILNNPEDNFKSVLFLPEGEDRKGEGGLRTQGYFKKSYDDKPLISIITVVYNGEKYLEDTIKSVISQTYDNVEYIIVDGGSTDGTIDIIKKYEDSIDYWISERDKGIYDAWNKGLFVSSGLWISFLGADDLYVKNAISKYFEYINGHKESIDYISSRVNLTDTDNKIIKIIGKKWTWKTFKKYMKIAHVGSLHNRILFQKVGLYDISYKISGDYELLLRKKQYLKTAFIEDITAFMKNGGVSNNMIKEVFLENKKAKIETGSRNSIIVTIEYYLVYLKYYVRKIIQ